MKGWYKTMKKFLVKGTNINNKPFEIPIYAESKEHAAITNICDMVDGTDLIKSIDEVLECVE